MNNFDICTQCTLDDVRSLVNDKVSNPTVSKLIFMETRPTENSPAKVFPCYIEGYGVNTETDEMTDILISIIQCFDGDFGMATVKEKASQIGVKYRLWNLPPAEALIGGLPMKDSEVPQ